MNEISESQADSILQFLARRSGYDTYELRNYKYYDNVEYATPVFTLNSQGYGLYIKESKFLNLVKILPQSNLDIYSKKWMLQYLLSQKHLLYAKSVWIFNSPPTKTWQKVFKESDTLESLLIESNLSQGV